MTNWTPAQRHVLRPLVRRRVGGVSEQKLQQIHKVYVEAKRRTGEQSTLTVEALRAQMARQVPLVQAKHGCEQVDFKVILKDGKAMLKAIPK